MWVMRVIGFLNPLVQTHLGSMLKVLAVVIPYAALYLIVPKWLDARNEVASQKALTLTLMRSNDDLESLRQACNAATDTMRKAREAAEHRRSIAETKAAAAEVGRTATIERIRQQMKEPADATQECIQIKSLVDSYSGRGGARLRIDPAPNRQDSGSAGAGALRQNDARPPAIETRR
jgi:hypothetical protein